MPDLCNTCRENQTGSDDVVTRPRRRGISLDTGPLVAVVEGRYARRGHLGWPAQMPTPIKTAARELGIPRSSCWVIARLAVYRGELRFDEFRCLVPNVERPKLGLPRTREAAA